MKLMNNLPFEGGNLSLNSGGLGPDDYLLKQVGTRKPWVKVVIRHGVGLNEEYKADLKAIGKILIQCKRVSTRDLKKKYRASMPVMNASDFLAEFERRTSIMRE